MNSNPLQLLTKNWYFNAGIKAIMRFVGVLVLLFTLTLLLFKGLDILSIEDIKHLAGFFLGLEMGLLFSSAGLMMAGSLGYLISRYHGAKLLTWVCKDESEQKGMIHLFQTLGPLSLLLCRAAPMLPEITSCLAGTTRMPYWKYVLYYALGSLPYSAIAVYSGSISTVDNPSPALYTYVGMFAVLGLIGLIVLYFKRHELMSLGNEDHETSKP